MTTSGNKPNKRGGRPRGIVRSTHVKSGAYARPEQLPNVLKFWQKHKPCNARRCDEIIQKYLRGLRWDTKHQRYNEVRDLAILTVSRSELFMLIVEKDFTRDVFDEITGNLIKQRSCDQLRKLEQLDEDIQNRLKKLELLSKITQKKETQI